MLQQHLGSVWLGDKINEKVKELTQQQNHAKRGRRCLLLTSDKRLRFWTMAGLPFLFFYATGQIISINTYFVIKILLVGVLYLIASTIGRWMFDDQLLTLLPLSIYLATKVSHRFTKNFNCLLTLNPNRFGFTLHGFFTSHRLFQPSQLSPFLARLVVSGTFFLPPGEVTLVLSNPQWISASEQSLNCLNVAVLGLSLQLFALRVS